MIDIFKLSRRNNNYIILQDPPTKSPRLSRQSSKSSTPSKTPRKHQMQPTTLQLDNPLYHVCEGKN